MQRFPNSRFCQNLLDLPQSSPIIISTLRPVRRCRDDRAVLEASVSVINAVDAEPSGPMTKLMGVWTPGDDYMLHLKNRSPATAPGVFCSVNGFERSIQDAVGMASRRAFRDENIDDYARILATRMEESDCGFCVFLPISWVNRILSKTNWRDVSAYIDDKINDRDTVALVCPFALQKGYALVCVDFVTVEIHLFNAEDKDIASYTAIFSAFKEFLVSEMSSDKFSSWRYILANRSNRRIPNVPAVNSGPLVCVLMDILSQSVAYETVDQYVDNASMPRVRAMLYNFMHGFNYSNP